MQLKREFKIIDEEIKYRNPWLCVKELKTLKDGKKGIYGVVYRSDTSAIIIKTIDSKILLLKQYRFPTDSFGWELPMGGIEDNETPQKAAERELFEETGIKCKLSQLGSFYPVPGLTPQKVFAFSGIISDEKIKNVVNSEIVTDEIIERKFFSLDEISKMIKNNEISDGFTLSTLSLLKWL